MSVELVVLLALLVAVIVFGVTFLVVRRPKDRVVVREVPRERQAGTTIEEPEPEKPKTRRIVQLIVTDPQGGEKNYQIESDVFNIGREDDNDLILDQNDRTTSRYHARIRKEGKGEDVKYILADLDSKIGTLVNGKKIEEKQKLNDGDKIVIGKTQMSFVCRDFQVL